MTCVDRFEQMYKTAPEAVAFCPYRICPLGAHVDHNYGKITGFAIDKGISIAYSPTMDGSIEMSSLQFDKKVRFMLDDAPIVKQNDWADYLRGAAVALRKNHHIFTGLRGVIEGSLPIGGLSSSAAVIISFLSALCRVNGIRLTDSELIQTALFAENKFVGVACGKLDQSCEVFSRKNHMLYLDTQNDSYELIPTHPDMKPYRIAIFFSGIERTLAGSKFNMRVDECRSAAYALKAYAGMDYGKYNETYLRDVPYEVFLEHGHKLPENFAKRAEHWFTEYARVEQGVQAWRRGDIETYGRLSFESGRSSIEKWQTGSPELKELYEIMTRTDGIYGGRFSGAGFKGCCMALIDPAFEESIIRKVTDEYLRAFPELKGRYSAHICESADGVNA